MRLHDESVGLGFDWMVTFARHWGIIVHQIDESRSICKSSFRTPLKGSAAFFGHRPLGVPDASVVLPGCLRETELLSHNRTRTHTLAVDQGCRRMTIRTLAGLERLKNVVGILKDRLVQHLHLLIRSEFHQTMGSTQITFEMHRKYPDRHRICFGCV